MYPVPPCTCTARSATRSAISVQNSLAADGFRHLPALRSWVKQAEIDGGERPGTTTGDKQRIAELEVGGTLARAGQFPHDVWVPITLLRRRP